MVFVNKIRQIGLPILIGGLVPPIIFATLILGGCERRQVGAQGGKTGEPIASLDGKTLYKKDFELYLPDDYERTITLDEKREYFDRWVTTELLYSAANDMGIGLSETLESRLEQYKKDLVADRFVQKIIGEQAIVNEDEVRTFYNAHEREYITELRVSHILVNSLEDADEVREQLTKKAFSWVARRSSIDRHTGPGGDLGYLSKGNMIPEFESVVFHMKVGEISDVIESEFGYHFITVTSSRNARDPITFDEAAEQISLDLLLKKRATVYETLVRRLRKEANLEVISNELRWAAQIADTTGN